MSKVTKVTTSDGNSFIDNYNGFDVIINSCCSALTNMENPFFSVTYRTTSGANIKKVINANHVVAIWEESQDER